MFEKRRDNNIVLSIIVYLVVAIFSRQGHETTDALAPLFMRIFLSFKLNACSSLTMSS